MTTNLDSLIAAADLTDREDRLMLADALEEAGRTEEAEALRSDEEGVLIVDGVVNRWFIVVARDESGDVFREEISTVNAAEAESIAESIVEEWLQGGDYGDGGAVVCARFVVEDEHDEEVAEGGVRIEIEPDHDALIRAAGGDASCDHDWTSEGEGGCDDNPGVWSTGGTSFTFTSHCRLCGLHRTERTCGSQRNPGEHDTVEYDQPDSWCAECQAEECECDEEDDQ